MPTVVAAVVAAAAFACGCNPWLARLVFSVVNLSEEESFSAFVRESGDGLLRYARLLFADAGDAEDALQTALLRVARQWHRGLDAPVAYARTALRNLACDSGRRRHLVAVPSDAEPVLPAGLAGLVVVEHRRRSRSRRRFLGGVGALALTGALAAAALPERGDYKKYEQPSGATAPTVAAGQQVVLRRDAVPERGDVVLFTVRTAGEAFESLSRVVGLPGDVVSCPEDGAGRCDAVVVSGKELDEPWLTAATEPFGPVTVGAGLVFLLGDSRDAANDSRYVGTQQLADVMGAVVARVEPDGTLVPLPSTPRRPLPEGEDIVDPSDVVPPAPARSVRVVSK